MMRIHILILYFSFLSLAAFSQDLAGEIDRFNGQILSHTDKRITASVWVMDSKVSAQEEMVGKMELVQSGTNCYYRFLDIEVIQNDKLMLQIDHAEKTLQVYGPADTEEALGQYSPSAVKAFISQSETITPLATKAGCNGYRIGYGEPDDGLAAIELYFEKSTGQLKETKYCYVFYDWVTNDRSSYTVRIVYEKYDFSQVPAKGMFSTDNIVVGNGNAFYPKGDYKTYSLWVADELKNKP